MSARDDYPLGNGVDWHHCIIVEMDREMYEAMCDEIDRLRAQLARVDDWLDGQGYSGVDAFAS